MLFPTLLSICVPQNSIDTQFFPLGVTGAPYREVNSKVATAPQLKVEDKDRVNNSRRIQTVKLNIVKLKASLNLVLSRKSWLSM